MTQKSVESLIGKLISDEALRRRYEADRAGTLAQLQREGLELNSIEISALENLDLTELERLAETIDPRLRRAAMLDVPNRRGPIGMVALAALALGSITGADAELLTLDRVVQLALQANRELVDNQLDLDSRALATASAKRHRYPTLDLEATRGKLLSHPRLTIPAGGLGNVPGVGPFPSEDRTLEGSTDSTGMLSATLSQPLSQLHSINLTVRARRLDEEIGQQQLRATRHAVAYQARSLCFELHRLNSLTQAARQRLESLNETLRVARVLENEGTLRADQRLTHDAALALEQARIAELENRSLDLKAQLNDLLDRDLTSPLDLAPLPELATAVLSLEQSVQRALERRPEIAEAQLRVSQAETQHRIERADRLPQVSLAVTHLSYSDVELLPENVTLAGLSISWDPTNLRAHAREIKRAKLTLERTKTTQRSIAQRVEYEVRSQHRAVESALAQLEAQHVARQAAAEQLRVVRDAVSAGSALSRELLGALSQDAAADHDYFAAELDYRLALANLQRSIGAEDSE
jgi:outer membrane protein TolC